MSEIWVANMSIFQTKTQLFTNSYFFFFFLEKNTLIYKLKLIRRPLKRKIGLLFSLSICNFCTLGHNSFIPRLILTKKSKRLNKLLGIRKYRSRPTAQHWLARDGASNDIPLTTTITTTTTTTTTTKIERKGSFDGKLLHI